MTLTPENSFTCTGYHVDCWMLKSACAKKYVTAYTTPKFSRGQNAHSHKSCVDCETGEAHMIQFGLEKPKIIPWKLRNGTHPTDAKLDKLARYEGFSGQREMLTTLYKEWSVVAISEFCQINRTGVTDRLREWGIPIRQRGGSGFQRRFQE